MKHLILLGVLFLFSGQSYGQNISDDQIQFANRFVAAVKDHDYKLIYRHLDKKYRKQQSKFLSGGRTQLIDELFSGDNNGEFVTMQATDIIRIEIAEVIALDNGNFTYIFRVRNGVHDILAPLELVKNRKRFGFVGAVG